MIYFHWQCILKIILPIVFGFYKVFFGLKLKTTFSLQKKKIKSRLNSTYLQENFHPSAGLARGLSRTNMVIIIPIITKGTPAFSISLIFTYPDP